MSLQRLKEKANGKIQPMMERTIDGFRGFLDCLEEPKECGTIYGVGAWKVGEINDKPSMHEAYEMGKKV